MHYQESLILVPIHEQVTLRLTLVFTVTLTKLKCLYLDMLEADLDIYCDLKCLYLDTLKVDLDIYYAHNKAQMPVPRTHLRLTLVFTVHITTLKCMYIDTLKVDVGMYCDLNKAQLLVPRPT